MMRLRAVWKETSTHGAITFTRRRRRRCRHLPQQVTSYWSSTDMLWMDGVGSDGAGPCAVDAPAVCATATFFSDFCVGPIAN